MDEDLKSLISHHELTPEVLFEANKRSIKRRKFSYIPYLVKPSYVIPDLDMYSTIKLLEFLESIFLSPKSFQEEIEYIGQHLKKRKDLFQSFLDFTEKRNFKDDLYYWHPDVKHTNIFSFVCDLFSDISSIFIQYTIKSLIVSGSIQWNLLEILENKLTQTTLAQIAIMRKDIQIFESEIDSTIPKNNLPVSSNFEFHKKIISHSYWTDSTCIPFDFFEIKQVLHKNRQYTLCSCFSMIEVEFSGKKVVNVLVTLKAFEGLLLKKENMKSYWIDIGIVDEGWNFII